MIFGEEPENSEPKAVLQAVAATLRQVQPLARRLQTLGLLGPAEGVLTMPEVEPAQ
jgi:hypothetical protein